MADQKRALRRAMADARARLTPDERARAAHGVAARLAALPELRTAVDAECVVAGFAATRGEIDPALALENARRGGARLAWPRVTAKTSQGKGEGEGKGEGTSARPRLHFHVAEADELRAGTFGIAEPDGAGPEIASADVAVMLVPGLAFDPRGNRLGFGGGYYDEVLADAGVSRPAFVVGVGYDFQVVDACPADERDGRVDCVVTEARVIRCHGGGEMATGGGAGGPVDLGDSRKGNP